MHYILKIKEGSQVDVFGIKVTDFINRQKKTVLISSTFKAILKVLGKFYCQAQKLDFSIIMQIDVLGVQIKDLAFPIITVPSYFKLDKNLPKYDQLKIIF